MLTIQKLYSLDQPLPPLDEDKGRMKVQIDRYAYAITWTAEWDWLLADPAHLAIGAVKICYGACADRMAKGDSKVINWSEGKALQELLREGKARRRVGRRRGFG
jgi:hypothetical protein